MADTSSANLIINYGLTNILMKLMGYIVCYILHNLITLRHNRGDFPSSESNPARYPLIFHGYC